MAFYGRRLLPSQTPLENRFEVQQMEDNLAEVYRLEERLVRARVPTGSPLAGKQLDQSNLRETYNLNLIALERNGQDVLTPSAKTTIQPGDHLLLAGRPEEINQQVFQSDFILLQDSTETGPKLDSPTIELIETVLAPRSNLIGQTLRQARFREKHEMNVIAIWRAGRPIRTALSDLPLQFGDALLLLGPRSRINLLRTEPNLILLREGERQRPIARKKAWLATLIMGVSVLLSSIFSAYIGEIMLGGALVMILAGILTMEDAYRAIDWKTIFIIAGMLPLGIALTNTGAAAAFGNWALGLVGASGPQTLLATLALLTVLFTQIMNGAVVTAILVPIGISIANQAGLDPRSLTMGIALAASMAFITPFGHPVNLLVMGPAGYRTRDYVRVGLPLTIILLILVIFVLPVFWPLS
jgi:di/tricarboxylate transporter